jgi:hypothetical protein
LDVETVDQEYQQLQQESQTLTQAIQEFAAKLQGAGDAGDAQAKEWVLDLKSIALQIQQEQLQTQALLQALHDLTVNAMQPAPPAQAAAPVQAAAPQQQRGGMLSSFTGGGFGQAMKTGLGMGAGFGLADSVINGIFGN